MTRYIDADALKFHGNHIGDEYEDIYHDKQWVYRDEIDDAPTIDAVAVVLCKDCRHANECHKSVQYTRNEPRTVTLGYAPIEFCSHGERRSNECK